MTSLLFTSSPNAGGISNTFLRGPKQTSLQFNLTNFIENTGLNRAVPLDLNITNLARKTFGGRLEIDTPPEILLPETSFIAKEGAGFIDELDQASGQMGTGIFSRITNFLNKATNILPSSDSNARPQFSGEKHAVFKLPNGLPGRANFAGPGTRILERLRRQDPPRNLTDKTAQAHDIRYALAEDTDDIRSADMKMIDKLKNIRIAGQDSKLNTDPSLRIIQAKVAAENFSLLDRGKFAEFDRNMSSDDTNLLKSTLTKLKQEGFGSKSGRSLRMKLLRRLL